MLPGLEWPTSFYDRRARHLRRFRKSRFFRKTAESAIRRVLFLPLVCQAWRLEGPGAHLTSRPSRSPTTRLAQMTSSGALSAAPFDERRYAAALGRCGIGAALRVYDRVGSTMVVADELLRAEGSSRAHGKLVLAETQTAGQGRRGRTWQSEAGNLYFSLVWAPQPAASPAEMLPELVRLNLATGVAVVHAVAAAGFPGARIKWPNDVYHGTPPRKLSGMLVNFNGQDAAILGVGINVLQDMPEAGTAVSLAMLQSEGTNAKVPVREDVLAHFCKELERLMALSNAAVLAEYEENDFLRGKTIRVHHKTREEHDPRDFLAEVLGVDSSGMLRVRSLESSGKELLLSGEEVSITPQRS